MTDTRRHNVKGKDHRYAERDTRARDREDRMWHGRQEMESQRSLMERDRFDVEEERNYVSDARERSGYEEESSDPYPSHSFNAQYSLDLSPSHLTEYQLAEPTIDLMANLSMDHDFSTSRSGYSWDPKWMSYRSTADVDWEDEYNTPTTLGKTITNKPPWKHARATSRCLPIILDGYAHPACADTGCEENCISEEYAYKIGAIIQPEESPTIFNLPVRGRTLLAIGYTEIECDFPPSALSPIEEENRLQKFFVFQDLAKHVIVGRQFLDATQTLTRYSGRLEAVKRSRFFAGSISLPYLTCQYMHCWADGVKAEKVLADTGSDFNMISAAFASRLGYDEYETDNRTDIIIADSSEMQSLGTIDLVISFREPKHGHQSTTHAYVDDKHACQHGTNAGHTNEVKKKRHSFTETFHVVHELARDLILGETFLYSVDAFKGLPENFTFGVGDRLCAPGGPLIEFFNRRQKKPQKRRQQTLHDRFVQIKQQDPRGRGVKWYNTWAEESLYVDCEDFNGVDWRSGVTNGDLWDHIWGDFAEKKRSLIRDGHLGYHQY